MWDITFSSKTFVERFRDWDWDFYDIWLWFYDTAAFHIENNGPIAIVAIVAVVIFVLLQIDMTSYITELVMASVVRSIGTFLTMLIGGSLVVTLVKTLQITIAKGRNSIRNIRSVIHDKNGGS